MKKIGLFLFGICLVLQLLAQEQQYFMNPVIRGDIPDPTIIQVKDTYYATGTSSEWAPFYPMFSSKDLVNWKQIGHVFTKQPEWTSNSFWAPELFYYNDKIYCYYTARQKSTGISYIGVAIADSPLQEFVDYGPIVEYGTEAIDAFVYNDNGQLYISWKAYGLDKRPIELLGCKLSSDGLELDGEPFSLLVDDEDIGMEGQCHFKQGDYYYIIYSAHVCCGPSSNYDVYVARSTNFLGPYEKYRGNPILCGGEGEYLSCGHGTVVKTSDGRMYYLCHAYSKGEGFYLGRQPILQEMEITDDHWIHFKTGRLATVRQAVPFTGVVQQPLSDFEDTFKLDKLKVDWTWNYLFSDIHIIIKKGNLFLSGTPKRGTENGTALCLRSQSSHYMFETKVMNFNKSLKGLTLYGDDKNLIVWGTVGDKLLLKNIKDDVASTLYEIGGISKEVYLRIEVEQGIFFHFYWSKDGKKWEKVQHNPLKGDRLIRWDRVQRPGLIHNGDTSAPAEFAYFRMNNRK